MMIRRIVVDTVRRMWTGYAMAGALIYLMNLIGSPSRSDWVVPKSPPDVLAWSLTATWFLGFLPSMALEGREIAQLPVSRREMWIVRWCLAVVVTAVLFAAVFGAAGLLRGAGIGIARVLTAALYCGLYGGCYMAITAVFPLLVASEPGMMFRALVRFIAIPLGGAVLPFSFSKYLPTVLTDATNPVAGFLIAAAGVTAAGYFYRPEILERLSPPKLHSRGASAFRKSRLLDYLQGNTLTGLPRLFWVHAREIVLMTPLAFLMLWFVDGMTSNHPSGSPREFFHALQLMPFDLDSQFGGRHGFNVLIFVFVAMGFKMREIMWRTRALRILPLTATTLSLVFTGQSVLTATIVWAWLVAVHVAAVGSLPPTLRADIFLVFAGGLTLYRAVELALPSRFASGLVGAVLFVPPVIIATTMFTSPQLIMVIAGVLSIAAGTVFQIWLLRRRHKIYQFKPQTFFGRQMPS